MQDRKANRSIKPLATHGRTIHWGHFETKGTRYQGASTGPVHLYELTFCTLRPASTSGVRFSDGSRSGAIKTAASPPQSPCRISAPCRLLVSAEATASAACVHGPPVAVTRPF
jgi:hypothetical protein